jgi:hypothetical protein
VKLAVFVSFVLMMSLVHAENAYNKGVEAWRSEDYAQARNLWTRSISEGGPDSAYNNLGVLYYHGLGGARDRAHAVTLWRKGAALSVSESQFHLGQAYAKGHGGLQRSAVQAFAWYECARVAAGRLSADDPTEKKIAQSAQEALAKLVPAMSREGRTAGGLLAQQYIDKYGSPLKLARSK